MISDVDRDVEQMRSHFDSDTQDLACKGIRAEIIDKSPAVEEPTRGWRGQRQGL